MPIKSHVDAPFFFQWQITNDFVTCERLNLKRSVATFASMIATATQAVFIVQTLFNNSFFLTLAQIILSNASNPANCFMLNGFYIEFWTKSILENGSPSLTQIVRHVDLQILPLAFLVPVQSFFLFRLSLFFSICHGSLHYCLVCASPLICCQ